MFGRPARFSRTFNWRYAEGTVRLRKDGRWEGRVVIGYDDKGLPKTKNVLARTKGECVEKLSALKNVVTPTAAVKVRSDMPFGEWMTFWYETCKPAAPPPLPAAILSQSDGTLATFALSSHGLSSSPKISIRKSPTTSVRPNTRTGYENNIRLYIRPRLGNVPLNKLTANDLQRFINWMRQDGRSEYRESRGDGLSANTIRHCYGLCRRALEKAVAEKLISQNPAKECKLPSARRMEMRLLNREELQKLLIQARAEGYYEVFLLELTTGLRVGELMALQWDDLNLNTGELRIERQVYQIKGELLIQPPKNKASIRTVILPPAVVAALRMYKQAVSSRWIFPSPKKEDAPIAPSVVSHRLAKILKHAGCKKVRFHDLGRVRQPALLSALSRSFSAATSARISAIMIASRKQWVSGSYRMLSQV